MFCRESTTCLFPDSYREKCGDSMLMCVVPREIHSRRHGTAFALACNLVKYNFVTNIY